MAAEEIRKNWRDYALLAVLLLLTLSINSFWLSADRLQPGPDESVHALRSLYYYDRLSSLLGSERNATSVLSEYGNRTARGQNLYPPFVYLTAIPYLASAPSPTYEAQTLFVNGIFTAILLLSTYSIGAHFSSRRAGLIAAALLMLFPMAFGLGREFLLDYGLMAMAALNIAVLLKSEGFSSKPHSILFGIVFGLGMLTKQTHFIFLIGPVLTSLFLQHPFKLISNLKRNRQNLAYSLLAMLLIAGPWYALSFRPGLLFEKQAQYEQGLNLPPVLSLPSLLYYASAFANDQAYALLAVLFLISLPSLLRQHPKLLLWLAIPYALFTLIRTKDPRFTAPLLPLVAIFCAHFLDSLGAEKRKKALAAVFTASLFILYISSFGLPLPQFLPSQLYAGTSAFHLTILTQQPALAPGQFGYSIPRVASSEDWQVEQTVSYLRALSKDQPRTACLFSYQPLYDIGALKLLLFQQRSQLNLPSLSAELACDPPGLSRCDFLIIKTPVDELKGLEPYKEGARRIYSCYLAEAEKMSKAKTFALPDGSEANVYLR